METIKKSEVDYKERLENLKGWIDENTEFMIEYEKMMDDLDDDDDEEEIRIDHEIDDLYENSKELRYEIEEIVNDNPKDFTEEELTRMDAKSYIRLSNIQRLNNNLLKN